MSLKTWKKEFYPKKPSKRMTKLEAVQHSLLKWQGLVRSNLKKHGLHISTVWGHIIRDSDNHYLEIDTTSCVLCVKYLIHSYSDYENDECEKCPLYAVLGDKSCGRGRDGDPYTIWAITKNPQPMIRALKKTLKMVEKEME